MAQDFWEQRSIDRVNKIWKDEKKIEKELSQHYKKALQKMRETISLLYINYSDGKNMTYDEAVRELNSYEIRDYKEKLNALYTEIKRTGNEEAIATLEKLQRVTNLNRLQAVTNQIEAELAALGVNQEYTMGEYLNRTYERNYYQTIYNIQTGTGIGTGFAILNQDAIRTAVMMPWSGDHYSSRIWTDKTKLIETLRQTITQGLIRGDSLQKQAYHISKRMDAGFSNALRLVRTETAFVIGESTAHGYRENGIVLQYKYIAILDDRTSKTCETLDGKIFDVQNRKPGVNASPMHPNCRSTEAPYFSRTIEEVMEDLRRERKEAKKIQKNMKYDEWFSAFGKRNP